MNLPVFPLGTVLVPTSVLPLHVFEPRYRALMDDLTGGEAGLPAFEDEFGVVLIERGSEIGGGDARSRIGTVARIMDATRLPDGRWVVAVVGTRRFRVVRWLPDEPYPRAEVDDATETEWNPADDGRLADVARLVRRTLALGAEIGERTAPVTFELSEDPLSALWQLCALTPLGTWDQQRLVECDDPGQRLRLLGAAAEDLAGVLAMRLAGGQ